VTRSDAWVAAGHPETVAAATALLLAGGNAYDAVIAAGFAAAVAEPGLSSLGGGGFLLAAPTGGDPTLVDFFVDTPGRGRRIAELEPHFTPVTIGFRGAEQVFHAGYGAVASPGCLAGYLHAHERFGRLPLADVVAPARTLATDGVVLNEQQAELFGLLDAIFTLTPEGRALFAPEGRRLGVGDRFTNPGLADLLTEIGDGTVRGFDSPVLAEALHDTMTAGGGLLSRDDLDEYRVIERAPLAEDMGRLTLLTNPAPSFGGTLVARALRETDGADDWTDPEAIAELVGALVAVSDHHAGRGPRSSQGTTHISVGDHDGNLASLTTSNGSCSGTFVPGTGVQLNNIMGEADLHPHGFHASPPGLRVGSMMAPSLVQLPDGRRVVLGSGGSERIRSALTLTMGLLARGASLDEAIEHPRVHWDGSAVQLEPGWPDAVVDRLRRDRPVNVWPGRNLYFGGVHAVAERAGSWPGDAWGDPRRGGSTARVAG
jgi:gamma-glutamyltranspeptidase/glutathione hydrolase